MSDAREAWSRLVSQWRSSGETAREFASRHGVNASTLSGWAWRLGREGGSDAGTRPRSSLPTANMIEVRAVPTKVYEECFELEVGGRRVRVPPSFDEDALRRLIDVLEDAR
jgi:transposase-like protein